MKQCAKCGISKPLFDFNKNKTKSDGLQTACRDCNSIYLKQHYRLKPDYYKKKARSFRKDLKQKYWDYLSTCECEMCGEKHPACLDFDHIDPKTKKDNVSKMVHLKDNWDMILKEIAKCRVLCANCHRKVTAKQNNWYKGKV